MIPGKYIVYGSDPSFFTCKVLVMFRYMNLPHDYRYRSQDKAEAFQKRSGSRMVPIVETPEKWVIWDSTPIGELLNARFPAQAIVPQTPVQKITMKILEDFVDEWLPRQALYYRWAASDALDDSAREIACNGFLGKAFDDNLTDKERQTIEAVAANIKENFGIKVCKVAGCGPEYKDEIESSFIRILNLVTAHFKDHDYFFGSRASMADLALAGASVAHFMRDDASREVVDKVAPSFGLWTQKTWDAKAEAGTEFLSDDALPATLLPLLEEIATRYHVYLRLNHQALLDKQKTITFDYGYGPIERRAYRYSELSRQDVKATLEALPPADQGKVRAALGKTGVLDIYDLEPIDCGFGSIASGLE